MKGTEHIMVLYFTWKECFVYSNDAQVWGERFIHTHLVFKAYVSGFPRVEKALHHSELKWGLATSTHTLQKLAISHIALTYIFHSYTSGLYNIENLSS